MRKFVNTPGVFPRFFFFSSVSLSLPSVLSRSAPSFVRDSCCAFGGGRDTGMTLGRGINGCWGGGGRRGVLFSPGGLRASFVLRSTEPGPPDRRRRPATSSASAGFFLSRWTSFCSCHLSHSLFSSLSLSPSRSSRGDTRSAPAVHRYALGSGGSRV